MFVSKEDSLSLTLNWSVADPASKDLHHYKADPGNLKFSMDPDPC